MAKGYFDIFSMESDNDEIDVGMNDLVKDETDVVEDAGSDTEVVDMNPSTSETSHNEEASAGGIATGSNQDDLEMDPVAASESFIRRNFGLSVEDMEEVVEEKVAEAAVIPSADEEAPASPVAQDVADGVTTINIVPAEGTTAVPVDPVSEVSESVEVPIESESDVASIENLHKIFSREDGEPDESASGADVEFSVTTPNNSMDFEMEGKAVTIEPTGDTGSEPAGEATTEEPSEDEGGEQPAEGGEGEAEGGEPAEEGNDVGEEPEAGAESWRDAWTF
jgi:hypothetical protein